MQGPTHHQGTLGIATNFASRKEVVGDIFHDTKGKEKRQEDADEGGFGRNSKKKNKQSCREPLMAVAKHKKPRAPPEGGSGSHAQEAMHVPSGPGQTNPQGMRHDESLLIRGCLGEG
jgi:hypothetical protein